MRSLEPSALRSERSPHASDRLRLRFSPVGAGLVPSPPRSLRRSTRWRTSRCHGSAPVGPGTRWTRRPVDRGPGKRLATQTPRVLKGRFPAPRIFSRAAPGLIKKLLRGVEGGEQRVRTAFECAATNPKSVVLVLRPRRENEQGARPQSRTPLRRDALQIHTNVNLMVLNAAAVRVVRNRPRETCSKVEGAPRVGAQSEKEEMMIQGKRGSEDEWQENSLQSAPSSGLRVEHRIAGRAR
jgi:hypothetical protein